MPRPKGSKNRKPSVRRKGVANAESISEAKAAVATQIRAGRAKSAQGRCRKASHRVFGKRKKFR